MSSSTREAVIREKTVWSWAAISGGNRPPASVPCPCAVWAPAGGAAWGAWGRRPVLCWAAAAYFSSSVAARAPSPTAVTT